MRYQMSFIANGKRHWLYAEREEGMVIAGKALTKQGAQDIECLDRVDNKWVIIKEK